jgi:hypothetical protein
MKVSVESINAATQYKNTKIKQIKQIIMQKSSLIGTLQNAPIMHDHA